MAHTRETSINPNPAFWGSSINVVSSDPDTTYWGEQQAGNMWFNTTSNKIKLWNGTAVRTVTDT